MLDFEALEKRVQEQEARIKTLGRVVADLAKNAPPHQNAFARFAKTHYAEAGDLGQANALFLGKEKAAYGAQAKALNGLKTILHFYNRIQRMILDGDLPPDSPLRELKGSERREVEEQVSAEIAEAAATIELASKMERIALLNFKEALAPEEDEEIVAFCREQESVVFSVLPQEERREILSNVYHFIIDRTLKAAAALADIPELAMGWISRHEMGAEEIREEITPRLERWSAQTRAAGFFASNTDGFLGAVELMYLEPGGDGQEPGSNLN